MGAGCWCWMTRSTWSPVGNSLTPVIGLSLYRTGGAALATSTCGLASAEIDLGREPFQRHRYSAKNRRADIG